MYLLIHKDVAHVNIKTLQVKTTHAINAGGMMNGKARKAKMTMIRYIKTIKKKVLSKFTKLPPSKPALICDMDVAKATRTSHRIIQRCRRRRSAHLYYGF